MKAIIKYPGSKWSIADWIINFFPEHHTYLEPFFGSGAVLFNKTRIGENQESQRTIFLRIGKYETAAERQVLAANRRLAQLVEHLSYTQQVAGSNPASPIWLERIINRADCGSISAKRKHLETGAFFHLQKIN
mgnify:CR=1 FL=1